MRAGNLYVKLETVGAVLGVQPPGGHGLSGAALAVQPVTGRGVPLVSRGQ